MLLTNILYTTHIKILCLIFLDTKQKENKPAAAASSSGLTDQQREALLGQKDTYKKKLEILEREITKLQTKEDELNKNRADIRLVDENLKLQVSLITNKMGVFVLILLLAVGSMMLQF